MDKLKLLSTIFSKLESLTKNNGQIIISRDSKSLYVDLEGERIEITDWIDIDTEENLLAILTPLTNKYYYTKNNNKIWRYINNDWECLNTSVNDLTPTYTESPNLVKLSSGEKLSVAFGKISKAISDLISHISDTVKHITSDERNSWNNKYAKPTNGIPKSDLSSAVQKSLEKADTALQSVTKESIGLGNVDNTSDKDKPVSTAQQAEFDKLNSNLEDYGLDNKFANGLVYGYCSYSGGNFSFEDLTENDGYIGSKTEYSCVGGDPLKILFSQTMEQITIQFNNNSFFTVNNVDKIETVIPSGVTKLSFYVKKNGIKISNIGYIGIYINNQIDSLKNDLNNNHKIISRIYNFGYDKKSYTIKNLTTGSQEFIITSIFRNTGVACECDGNIVIHKESTNGIKVINTFGASEVSVTYDSALNEINITTTKAYMTFIIQSDKDYIME